MIVSMMPQDEIAINHVSSASWTVQYAYVKHTLSGVLL
jgi:hypothetical protein